MRNYTISIQWLYSGLFLQIYNFRNIKIIGTIIIIEFCLYISKCTLIYCFLHIVINLKYCYYLFIFFRISYLYPSLLWINIKCSIYTFANRDIFVITFHDFVNYDSWNKYYNINHFVSHQFPFIYNIKIYTIIGNDTKWNLSFFNKYLIYRNLIN